MTNNEAAKIMKAIIFILKNDDYSDEVEEAIHMAINALTAQQEPHWIPCKDHLPEEDGYYDITVHPDHVPPGCGLVDKFYWQDGKWQYFYSGNFYDVPVPIIAWKPLSEPYVERKEE